MEDRDKPDLPVEVEIEERFKELIEQLAARAPAEDITDADIDREVQAVRTRPAGVGRQVLRVSS